jgi:hypothetical protein
MAKLSILLQPRLAQVLKDTFPMTAVFAPKSLEPQTPVGAAPTVKSSATVFNLPVEDAIDEVRDVNGLGRKLVPEWGSNVSKAAVLPHYPSAEIRNNLWCLILRGQPRLFVTTELSQ